MSIFGKPTAGGSLFSSNDLADLDEASEVFGAEEDGVFGGEDLEVDAFGLEEDGADLLLQHYGADEDMDFTGLFVDAEGVESVPETTPFPVSAPLQGRLAMARRVRRHDAPGLLQAGYVKGVQDAMAHFGLVEPALQARMGMLWGEAATGTPVALPEAFGALPAGRKPPLFDANAAIEADAAELPPVYVADTAGARACLSAGQMKPGSEPFSLEDRFGDAALAGFIGSQRRAGARRAAERALAMSAAVAPSTSGGHGAAFVEDVEAAPHLFADGTILDPIYGKLQLKPCPSCSACSAEDVRAGHARACGICDGHGGVLIPQEDAVTWAGIRYGSLVPLVLGLGVEVVDGVLGNSASSAEPVRRPKPRRRPAFSWSTPDAPESQEDVARAIVPDRWLSTAAPA